MVTNACPAGPGSCFPSAAAGAASACSLTVCRRQRWQRRWLAAFARTAPLGAALAGLAQLHAAGHWQPDGALRKAPGSALQKVTAAARHV